MDIIVIIIIIAVGAIVSRLSKAAKQQQQKDREQPGEQSSERRQAYQPPNSGVEEMPVFDWEREPQVKANTPLADDWLFGELPVWPQSTPEPPAPEPSPVENPYMAYAGVVDPWEEAKKPVEPAAKEGFGYEKSVAQRVAEMDAKNAKNLAPKRAKKPRRGIYPGGRISHEQLVQSIVLGEALGQPRSKQPYRMQ